MKIKKFNENIENTSELENIMSLLRGIQGNQTHSQIREKVDSLLSKKQFLEQLIDSQEQQEKKGNLTEIGKNYLNGLKKAYEIIFG